MKMQMIVKYNSRNETAACELINYAIMGLGFKVENDANGLGESVLMLNVHELDDPEFTGLLLDAIGSYVHIEFKPVYKTGN